MKCKDEDQRGLSDVKEALSCTMGYQREDQTQDLIVKIIASRLFDQQASLLGKPGTYGVRTGKKMYLEALAHQIFLNSQNLQTDLPFLPIKS